MSKYLPLILVCLATVFAVAPAAAWNLVLADTVVIDKAVVSLGDIAAGPVPGTAAGLTICGAGDPGTSLTLSRRGILRRLVSAGIASGVRFRGPDRTVLVFAGQNVAPSALTEAVRMELQRLVPAPGPGAPNSWFDLSMPDMTHVVAGDWAVRVVRATPLEAGRNLVRCEILDDGRPTAFTVTAVLHIFGEVATAVRAVPRGAVLTPDLFAWTWRDLAGVKGGPAIGRTALGGASMGRSLGPGDLLRLGDLRPTPLVRAGDPVELRVVRGTIAVSVSGTARQNGCLGQNIPIRNELTGRLQNARVTGPGMVEWRR